eukprot:s196_g7.t1
MGRCSSPGFKPPGKSRVADSSFALLPARAGYCRPLDHHAAWNQIAPRNIFVPCSVGGSFAANTQRDEEKRELGPCAQVQLYGQKN